LIDAVALYRTIILKEKIEDVYEGSGKGDGRIRWRASTAIRKPKGVGGLLMPLTLV